MQTTTSMREEKKTKQNKRRNEGLQDNKTTLNARQDNTKQKAKAKHRLALNLSQMGSQVANKKVSLTQTYSLHLVINAN